VQLAHERFDVFCAAAAGLWPLIHPRPPVFARGTWVPRHQVEVQVRHSVTDHCRVDVLGSGDLQERTASALSPPAHAAGLGVGKVSKPWCVPSWLNKQVPEVGSSAFASKGVRCDDVGDQNKVVLGHRPARHELSPVPVLTANETILAIDRHGFHFPVKPDVGVEHAQMTFPV